jgi:hypothetical protein
MITVVVASALLGVMLGLVFRVVVLCAVLLIGTVALIATGLAQGAGLWPVLIVTLAVAGSLQLGYLLGVMVRFGASARRARSKPQEERQVTQRAWAERQ